MNLLIRLYPGDAVCLLVVSILVQIAIIALLAVIASRTFARCNGALRHCILLSALFWIPFSPLAAWRLSRTGLFGVEIGSAVPAIVPPEAPKDLPSETAPNVPEVAGKVEGPAALAPTQSPPTSIERADYLRPLISAAIILWLAGLAVLLIRLAYALRTVSGLRGQCRRAGAAAELILVDMCRSIAGAAHPSILVSDVVRGPVTVGVRRPAIILRAHLLQDLSEARIREILIHECVHASHGDYATGIVQRLIASVFWFHPLVHLLNRELSRAREEVCDNAVLRAGSATDYARTLLELGQRLGAQNTPPLVPGLFDRSWRLEQRVAGILNRKRVVMTRVRMPSRIAIGSIVVVGGLTLSAVGLTRGQTKGEDRAERTLPPQSAPATGSSAAPATGTSAGEPVGTWLDQGANFGPNFVSPEEEAVRAKQQQGSIAMSKASLSLQEAEIKLKKMRLDQYRKIDLFNNKAISSGDVEEAKLQVQLAEIQVERAKVEVEEARAASVPTRMIGLTVRDGNRGESDRYAEHSSLTPRRFLERHFQQALNGGWDISVVRRGNGQSHVVISGVRDLPEKQIGVQSRDLQAGDQVLVRRDIVRVLKGPGMDSPVVWQGALEGKKMTVPEVLKEAGVEYGPEDRNRRVLLQGWRVGGQKSWSASLSAIAGGFGASEVIEPSDTLVLNWQ